MESATQIIRDMEASEKKLVFIIKNIPKNGYATVAAKVGLDRRAVRDEIRTRKPLYSSVIINACIELIEFVTGKKFENE